MDFEEQRKEIDLMDDEQVLSRVDLHRKNKNKTQKKHSRFSLINVLLVLFTLIPIGIFAFVIISLNTSKEPITPKAEDEGFQFETSDKSDQGGVAITDKEEEEKKKAEEQKEKEALEKAEEEKKAEEARQKEAEEARKQEEQLKEEARQKEIARQKELERQQAEKEKQQAEANKNQNNSDANQQVGGKTHTVAPGETLYRISVNYYQTGDGVEKIKQANGLSSNSISVGQNLVIP